MTAPLAKLWPKGRMYRDPFAELDFAAADPNLPWLPDELLSLSALPADTHLDEVQRVRLSHVDFARLCAAGIWLEGLLVSRVTSRGLLGVPGDEARVMLEEVREEAGHSLMFLEMIDRAGLADVGLLGPTRLLSWIAHRLEPRDPELWAMVYIGESITNNFAARALHLASRGARVCPLALAVMKLHHREEGRHIAAARALLEARIARMGAARRRLFGLLLEVLLRRFVRATLYPTPASLAAIGIERPARVARAVRDCPERRRIAQACAAPAVALMARAGLATTGAIR